MRFFSLLILFIDLKLILLNFIVVFMYGVDVFIIAFIWNQLSSKHQPQTCDQINMEDVNGLHAKAML